MTDVKDVLVQAKHIVERGWCQGASTDGRGNLCIRAAISVAAGAVASDTMTEGDFVHRIELELLAVERLMRHLPEPWDSVPHWNDAADTTLTDVAAILDKAISEC